ncbi:hypothetical protein JTE90_027192 [Oedothorax gibbosus]|uniref:Uncharacterized protein n=1 Tax=Oedothorax gibbosus TaxID=931172 RepID=A0AAV6TMI1_9ARAC|nr:hypothetical protein JTE90_027192 [Oedothorax gibbosus]
MSGILSCSRWSEAWTTSDPAQKGKMGQKPLLMGMREIDWVCLGNQSPALHQKRLFDPTCPFGSMVTRFSPRLLTIGNRKVFHDIFRTPLASQSGANNPSYVDIFLGVRAKVA